MHSLLSMFEIVVTITAAIFFIYNQLPLNSLDRWWHIVRSMSEESADTFKYGSGYVSDEKYTSLRGSYFAMKMDYMPNEDKIHALLTRLEKMVDRTRSEERRIAIQADINVLNHMNQQLGEGFSEWQNYQASTSLGIDWKSPIRFPAWLFFIIAVFFNLLFATIFVDAFDNNVIDVWIMAAACYIMTNKTLRVSRSILLRRATNVIQVSTLLMLVLFAAESIWQLVK